MAQPAQWAHKGTKVKPASPANVAQQDQWVRKGTKVKPASPANAAQQDRKVCPAQWAHQGNAVRKVRQVAQVPQAQLKFIWSPAKFVKFLHTT